MKRLLIGIIVLAGGFIALMEYQAGAAPPRATRHVPATQAPLLSEGPAASFTSAQPTAKEDENAKQAILANVKSFMEAFNRQDVKPIVALFTEDCELIEYDGTAVHGRKELEDELEDDFADEPTARISVNVASLRFVTADVVIEEGKTSYYPDGKTLTAETEYQATHVKKGDRWLMSHVRSFDRVVLSPYDRLRDLEWLVGSWVDEGEDSIVESNYRWDENKTFLLNNFDIRVKGRIVLKGTQRIGWDPLSKQIKAWVFDTEGGYAESLWSFADGGWVIKAKGVRSDGKVVSVTNRLTQISKDRMRFESEDRVAGEENLPSLSVVAVRKPPAARQ